MKKITCPLCPVYCQLEIEGNIVIGHRCPIGEKYALDELKQPLRTLTTTIRTSTNKMLPVKTDRPIPKTFIFVCQNIIAKYQAQPPITKGQIIIKNILDTGSNIIATRSLD